MLFALLFVLLRKIYIRVKVISGMRPYALLKV